MLKLAEEKYVLYLKEMGMSDVEISKRMKKRIIQTTVVFLFFLVTAILLQQKLFYLFLIVAPFIAFKSDMSKVSKAHVKFMFERELESTKFMQLISPMLFEQDGNVPLYTIFSRLLPRLNSSLQSSLFQLMNEMRAHPNDITPFIDFAKRTSENDMFINFMIGLFDYQNSTTDATVLKELSENANNEMLKKVTDIINYKTKKVASLDNPLAIGVIIIMLPYLIFLIVYTVNSSNLF